MLHTEVLKINGKTISVKISGIGEKTIFFIHGSSMSSATWMPQLMNEVLQKSCRMIAIDIPGHGDSQWLDGPGEYGLKNLADVVRQTVDFFKPGQFILAGLSYGTNLIGEIKPPLGNCAGIMLVSPCIINDEFPPSYVITPGPFGHVVVSGNPSEIDLKEYINYTTNDTGVAETYYHTYRNTDPLFRQAIGNAIMSGGWTDELDNIQKWNVPVCVVFGKEEKLVKTDYLNKYPALWNEKVYLAGKAAHIINEENPDDFNRLLVDFAQAVFK